MRNKRGTATGELIYFVIIVFIVLVMIGIFAYAFNLVDTHLDQPGVMAGQVNLSNATASTFGQINTAILDKLNLIGLFILIGMIAAMLLNAYFTRNNYPKLFIVVDILILIVTYVIAVYIRNIYETIITTAPFNTFFTANMNEVSSFLLNLHIVSVVVGVIIIIISYSDIPRTLRDEKFLAVGET
jgi:hypothetical protein